MTSISLNQADENQLRAESTVVRGALVGMAIGAAVCAGIWIVIVVIALAGSGFALGPMILVGAGCGMFAGLFLGGWAGTTVACSALEAVEHEQLPKVREGENARPFNVDGAPDCVLLSRP